MSSNRNVRPIGEYRLGDLVMAKLGEHPYWPAEIRKCHQKSHYLSWKQDDAGLLWVHFFNDDSGGWVEINNIRKFNPSNAGRYLLRKGLYIKLQREAYEQAKVVFERRAARGPDDPGTPPPEPEMEIEEELPVPPPPVTPTPKRKKYQKQTARRKTATPARKNNNSTGTKTGLRRRASTSVYRDHTDTATDSDSDEDNDFAEKYDYKTKRRSTARNRGKSSDPGDMDDEILDVIGGRGASSSEDERDEGSESADDSTRSSGSEGSQPNPYAAAKNPADRIRRNSASLSSEEEEAEKESTPRNLSKRVSGTSLSRRFRRGDSTPRGEPKSSSPDASKTPSELPSIIPSFGAARKHFPVPPPSSTPPRTEGETTPTKTASEQKTPSSGGSAQRRRKSRFAPAPEGISAKEDAFAPPAGDIGSPLMAWRTGTPSAPPVQYDDGSPNEASPGTDSKREQKTRLTSVPSQQVEDPSVDGTSSRESAGDKSRASGENKSDGNLKRPIVGNSTFPSPAASSTRHQPSVKRDDDRSPSPMVVDGDCAPNGTSTEDVKDNRASEITIRETIVQRIENEGVICNKQAGLIECLTLETRNGVPRCPVNDTKERRAQFSQKRVIVDDGDRVSGRRGLRNSSSRKQTEKGASMEKTRQESSRRKRSHASSDDDSSDGDSDAGETEFRGEKRKGSPLVQQGNPKRTKRVDGGENDEVSKENELQLEIERLKAEKRDDHVEIERLKKELRKRDNHVSDLLGVISTKDGLLEDYKMNPSKVFVDLPDWPEWKSMNIPDDSQEATNMIPVKKLCEKLDEFRLMFQRFKSKVEQSAEKRKYIDKRCAALRQEVAPAKDEIRALETEAVEDEARIANTLGVLFVAKIPQATLGQLRIVRTVRRVVSSCKEMPQIYDMGNRLLRAWEKQRKNEDGEKAKLVEKKKGKTGTENANGTTAGSKSGGVAAKEKAVDAKMKDDGEKDMEEKTYNTKEGESESKSADGEKATAKGDEDNGVNKDNSVGAGEKEDEEMKDSSSVAGGEEKDEENGEKKDNPRAVEEAATTDGVENGDEKEGPVVDKAEEGKEVGAKALKAGVEKENGKEETGAKEGEQHNVAAGARILKSQELEKVGTKSAVPSVGNKSPKVGADSSEDFN